MSRLIAGVLVVLGLTACGLTESKCSQGEACRGGSGKCYTCDSPYACNSGGTCSSTIDGVACCTGGGGGGSSYYVNGSGCSSGTSHVYSGTSSSICYTYYNASVADHCTKILWKCN